MANDLVIVGGLFETLSTTAQRNDFTLFNSAPETAPPVPVVNAFYPSSGVVSASSYVGFDVTVEEDTLQQVIVWVKYAEDPRAELVYDGTTFSTPFLGSTEVITDGLRFRFKRLAGWPDSLTFSVVAIGSEGGVN